MVGIPSVLALLSPARRRKAAVRWVKVGEVDQLEAGVPLRVDFTESVTDAWFESRVTQGVWVYTADGTAFTVYNGRCTHLACSYAFDKEKDLFHCPCHHGMFNVKTGQVVGGPPPRPLDTLETKIENGVLFASFRNFRAGVSDKLPIS